MKKLLMQFARFSAVGVSAFAIDYGLLALLTEAFGVNYLVSATISFTVSAVYNYVCSMRFVFTHKDDMSRRREFTVFFVLASIGLLLNNLLLAFAVEVLGVHYLIAKIVVGVIVSLFNFTTRRVFLDADYRASHEPRRPHGR